MQELFSNPALFLFVRFFTVPEVLGSSQAAKPPDKVKRLSVRKEVSFELVADFAAGRTVFKNVPDA